VLTASGRTLLIQQRLEFVIHCHFSAAMALATLKPPDIQGSGVASFLLAVLVEGLAILVHPFALAEEPQHMGDQQADASSEPIRVLGTPNV
jgi:hypothetical protein